MRSLLPVTVFLVACPPTPTDADIDTGGSDVRETLCTWVEVAPAVANCTNTITRAPAVDNGNNAVAITYDALGLQTVYAVNGEVVTTNAYDERGRVVLERTALASNPGAFATDSYEWDACSAYTLERDIDGDSRVDEETDAVLRDDGRVESRVSTQLTGALEGQVRTYDSVWEDDRIQSSVSTVDGEVSLALDYEYGTDDIGSFTALTFRRADDTLFARSIAWTDEQGRDIRSEGFGADDSRTSLRTTVYDGTGIDASSTHTVDTDGDGVVDSTTVTTFLPDGRIAGEQTTTADDSWERSFVWDCP